MKFSTRTLPEPVAESTNKSSQINLVGVGGRLLKSAQRFLRIGKDPKIVAVEIGRFWEEPARGLGIQEDWFRCRRWR